MKNHQQFFEKALAIQAQRQEKLTEAEKKEIALQLGFSEADWQAVLASFEGHLERSKAFLQRENYQEALPELEEAIIIQPENPEVLAHLAWAYLGLFQYKKRRQDREKALQYTRECLQYEPSHALAHRVIDEFNPTKSKKSEEDYSKSITQNPKIQEFKARISAKVKEDFGQTVPPKKPTVPQPIVKAVKKAEDNWKPLKEVALFVGVIGGILLLFWLTFPQMKQAPKSSSEEIIQNTVTAPKVKQYEAKVPVLFVNKGAASLILAQQTDSTWLVKTPEGKEVFLLQVLKNDWRMQAQNEESREARFALNYAFYVKVTMLADNINRDKVRFRPLFLDDKMKVRGYKVPNVLWLEPFMPAYYCYKKGDVAYLKFHSIDKEYFIQSNLPVSDYQQAPAFAEINIEQIGFGLTQEEQNSITEIENTPKIRGIYYQGKKYDKLDIKVRNAYWGSEHSYNNYLNYYWVAEITNRDPKRSIESLRFETHYFDTKGKRIEIHFSHKVSAAIALHVFPILRSRDKILMELRNHLKIRTSEELAPYQEIHITEIKWR